MKMAGKDQAVAAKLLRDRLNEWDTSGGSERQTLLQTFLDEFSKEPCDTTLETRLASGGSLLLARFLVYLQMTYTQYRGNGTLLRAIGIFITSPDGDRFAAELIEGGLFVTLFDMVLNFECSGIEKAEVFGLLVKIAKRGRRYKEAICETHGIRVICESIYHSDGSKDNTNEEFNDTEKETPFRMPTQVTESKGANSRSFNSNTTKKSKSNFTKRQRWHDSIETERSVTDRQNVQNGVQADNSKCSGQNLNQRGQNGVQADRFKSSEQNTNQRKQYGVNADHSKSSDQNTNQRGQDGGVQTEPNDDDDELEVKKFRSGWDLVSIRSSVDRVCSVMLIKATELLVHLVNGNPQYQQELTTHVLKLLDPKNSIAVQLVACQVLRVVLPHNLGLCGRALEPATNLLGVSTVSLLYEAIQLLQVVAISPWRSELVHKLVGLVGAPHEHAAMNKQKHPLYITEPDLSDFPESETAAMFQVQADAILAMGHILSRNTLDEILAHETVLQLVETLATTFYPESQRRAAAVLRLVVSMSPPVGDQLAEAMPGQLLARIMADPVDAANTLTVNDARHLRSWVRVERGVPEERDEPPPRPEPPTPPRPTKPRYEAGDRPKRTLIDVDLTRKKTYRPLTSGFHT